ncbi:MAG TPA: SUMF1/EgtB/PvdO family nonheme iron enzyme, partial [Planctomycetota bacterium]|nr:SUMF1/EgtB/PvdO family nonheme iron enzyme [Planctomycetota bacterium]
SDVYGLGVTLYECACGRVPFEGDSAEQLFHQILSREPPPPRAARAAISRDLETVIRTAMAKERDRRYPDADALAEDLDALLEARPIRARPPGRLRRAVSWSRRHRPATAALATAAVASIAFAGFLVHRRAAADRELVASAIEEASSRLAEFRSLRASLSSLRDRVAAETRRFEAAHMPRAELESFRRDEDELARARRRLVELPVEAAEALRRAEVRDPSNAAARDLLADLHAEQWREALQTGDEIAAALHEAKTRENDPAGRHSRELDGTASVELAGAPDGAEVHLFRFELLSRVRPDGERRLVAVPFHPDRGLVLRDGGEIRPGDVVLEIEPEAPGSSAAEADLRPGDLVASIEGHPIEEANLVIEVEAGGAAARAGIRTGDRLVGLGSRAIGPDGSLEAIATTYEDGDPVAAVFARDGRETRVAVVKTKEPLGALLGVSIRGADALCSAPLPEPGFEFRGVRDGAPFRARRAPGASGTARAMRTADPLLVSADNRLGAAPIAPFAVPPGSYLLLVRAPGMDPLRLPVLATRGASVHAIASVIPAASGPPGFVRVPPGPFVCGGDPEALRPFDRHVVDLPGFWIARYETTVGEYAEFVNDPSTRARIDAASAQGDVVHIPRSADRPAGYWRRGADGRFQPNRNSREPVLGVSFDDATAYAEWRTARAREAGERWVYGLPTEDEWEKAARGVDGRAFAWGNVFDWRLCRAAWTRA